MLVPDNLLYTKDHEWLQTLDAGVYRIGITDYAQDALGDVVFVEIFAEGTEVKAGEAFGEAESTKSVSDLYAPVSGKIKSSNPMLKDNPGLVNSDPYGQGWMCEIEADEDISSQKLLSWEKYKALIKE